MSQLAGIGKKDRERLSAVLRTAKGVVGIAEASEALKLSKVATAKMLARWAKNGWLSRVRQGLYVAVPLDSSSADVPLEDPWIIASRLFKPCYIAGWSAAGYWDLTEQIFRTVVVMTTQRPRNRIPIIRDTEFLLRTIPPNALFGLKTIWRENVKVEISDAPRTILDLLNDPRLGGGIRSTADMLSNYLRSEKKDLTLLMDYANRFCAGAVWKRLGFLLEILSPNDTEAILECRMRMSTGYAKLDPKLPADKLITRWRLWVPSNWA